MTSFACPNCSHKFEIRSLGEVSEASRPATMHQVALVRSWLGSRTYQSGKPAPTQALHANLNEWAEANGESRKISKKMLGVVLSEAGWTPYRENNWRGWLPPSP